uniref:Uncharacterized protein n=1 Tax=Anguilla anguilla TaxID=7936 RepID=A0A0E9PKF4_ANGAN
MMLCPVFLCKFPCLSTCGSSPLWWVCEVVMLDLKVLYAIFTHQSKCKVKLTW